MPAPAAPVTSSAVLAAGAVIAVDVVAEQPTTYSIDSASANVHAHGLSEDAAVKTLEGKFHMTAGQANAALDGSAGGSGQLAVADSLNRVSAHSPRWQALKTADVAPTSTPPAGSAPRASAAKVAAAQTAKPQGRGAQFFAGPPTGGG